MLLELQNLVQEVDTRYLTDEELAKLKHLSNDFELRTKLYQKLAAAEDRILAELYQRIAQSHPTLFILHGKDVSAQCKNEVQYTFRHAVYAILLGEEWLQTNLLIWFQTIIRSLNLQSICDVVYQTLETLLQSKLPAAESQIICPIISTVRKSLAQP